MSNLEERMWVLFISLTRLAKVKIMAHCAFVSNSLNIMLLTTVTSIITMDDFELF